MRRPFVPWPDPRLRTAADPVEGVTDDIRALWDEMVETMDAMPGYGLAAPQIGVMLRLAVVDASQERGQAIRLANPEIITRSPEQFEFTEASPNAPGVHAKFKRSKTVDVAYTDHLGFRVRKVFDGVWATSVQHQIDHLNGRMFWDNLSRVKRDMLLRKLKKG